MPIYPKDVFVPGAFPIEKHNAYATRETAQDSFVNALSDGYVPVIFGNYGVGKTSLALHCGEKYRRQNKLIHITSVYNKTLASVFDEVLQKLNYSVTIEKTTINDNESSGEYGFSLGTNIFGYIKAKLQGKIGRKRKKSIGEKREIVIKSPTDQRIIDICNDNGIFLVVDEMHRATEEFVNDFSAFLKSFANSQCNSFRISILGTEQDPQSLVNRDPGIDRLLSEIELGPFSDNESKEMVIAGFKSLQIKCTDFVCNKIYKTCSGTPFLTQFICLNIARRILSNSKAARNVEVSHINNALDEYVKTKAKRVLQLYQSTIEQTGEIKYRKQILHAVALSPNEYVNMDEIKAFVSKRVGKEIQSTALSGPLRDLKSHENHNVLKDVERSYGQGRIHNLTTFADPAMKSIIRMIDQNIIGAQ